MSSAARERHFLLTSVVAKRLAPLCRGSSGRNGALRSLWAVADQGVVSGFSFAFNLLLARTLPESDFGIAVLVIGGLYMLHSVHRSLVLYPFSLRVAAASESEIRGLAVSASVLSLAVSGILGLVAAAAAIALSHRSLAGILVLTVLASQTHELFRWTFLAQLRHRAALMADLVRHGCALIFVVWISLRHASGTQAFFACVAAGALLGAAWQVWSLRLRPCSPSLLPLLAGDAWRLGRWDLMGGAISSVTAQVMPWSLAAWYGTVETARLQAVANLLGATHPVIFGLGNLITPAVARAAAVCVSTRLVAVRYAGLGFVVLFPYFLVLLLCPDLVLSAVYGPSSPYAVQTSPLRWFVAIYAMVYIASAAKAALSGLGRSPQVSIVSSVSLGLQLAVVLPLAFRGGLPAACLGAFLTYGCEAALAIRFLCRFTAAPRTGAQPVGRAFEVGVDIGTT